MAFVTITTTIVDVTGTMATAAVTVARTSNSTTAPSACAYRIHLHVTGPVASQPTWVMAFVMIKTTIVVAIGTWGTVVGTLAKINNTTTARIVFAWTRAQQARKVGHCLRCAL